ncbi:nitroreductase family protein [Thermodesulfobacteriota bacterium]
MSWVSIDYDKCNNCGICILKCTRCFTKDEEEITVQADEDCCSLCGQCVSLCPTKAIAHNKLDMNNFVDIDEPISFNTDEFIQFIRERRSHRLFRKKEIPKKVLEKLIDTVRYTPTGGNVQNVEIIVIQNPERIKRLSDHTVDFFDYTGAKAAEDLKKIRAEGKAKPGIISQLERTVRYRERMLKAREEGRDTILHNAPAVMIFHSMTQTVTAKDNSVIASTTMGLLARTMGLETTYIGLLEIASKSHQPIINELSLPEGHEIFSVLVIGYPKLKYLRTVDRKPIETRWE